MNLEWVIEGLFAAVAGILMVAWKNLTGRVVELEKWRHEAMEKAGNIEQKVAVLESKSRIRGG